MSLMTEDEAKAKWCPLARYTSVRGQGINRWIDDGDVTMSPLPARCIGSACMAFRWAPNQLHHMPDGQAVVVDKGDEDLFDGAWWDGRYVKGKYGYLHRVVAAREFGDLPDGMFVDHIDGDPLNNRRGNLRVVTKAQNAANAATRGGVSQYRGVYRTRNGKWASQIAKEGRRTCLGTFEDEREAAAAYDAAAKDVHGEYARLNLEPKLNSGRLGYCGAFGKVEP